MSVLTGRSTERGGPPGGDLPRRPAGPRSGGRAALRERLLAGGFLLPAALFVSVVLLAPFLYTLYRSFFSDYTHSTFNGLANYTSFFSDPNLLRSMENTLMWVAGAIVLPTGFGLAIAMLTDSTGWSRLARLSVTLPYAISGSAVAVVWSFILTSDGALNGALHSLGLDQFAGGWLLTWPGNTIVMIVANAWQATGVAVILFMVGLQTVAPETLEAAALDGAGPWQRFRHVVFPQLRPVTVIVVGMSLVGGLKAFDLIFVLTQGGPGRATETLAVSMYQETFLFLNPGEGAAIAVVLTVIVLLASWTYLRRQLPARGGLDMAGIVRKTVVALLALAWFLPTYLLLVNGLTSVKGYDGNPRWLPNSFGLFSNIRAAWKLVDLGTAMADSLYYAVVSSLVAVLLASLAAFASVIMPVRRRLPWFWIIYVGTLLPLQVFLRPLFLAYANTGLYDSQVGMLVVYVAIAIPFAFFVLRNFATTVPTEVVEAARIDGASWWRLFWSIHVPLSKSAMIAAFVFQFVAVWNDLLFGITLATSRNIRPVMAALADLQGTYSNVSPPVVLAGALVVSLPTVIVFLLAQRFFVSSLKLNV